MLGIFSLTLLAIQIFYLLKNLKLKYNYVISHLSFLSPNFSPPLLHSTPLHSLRFVTIIS